MEGGIIMVWNTVYTVTFNPALDYTMQIDSLAIGKTNRANRSGIAFGGKGINVSTVLHRFGRKTVALGFLAGFTGDALEKALQRQGLPTDFIHLPKGLTRINIKLKSKTETELNAEGPFIPAAAMEELKQKLAAVTPNDIVVLAGSLPLSLPPESFSDLCRLLYEKNIPFVVDTSGQALRHALLYRPFLVKPNRTELEEWAGAPLPDNAAVFDAAAQLQQSGAQNVLVSLGAEGAYLLDELGKTHICHAPNGTVIRTVGAGDSMVAGFLLGLSKGHEAALKTGVAFGSATAFSENLVTQEGLDALHW